MAFDCGHGPMNLMPVGCFDNGVRAYRLTSRGELTLNRQRFTLEQGLERARELNKDYGRKGHKPMWTTNRVGISKRIGY